MASPDPVASGTAEALGARLRQVRAETSALAEPLSAEDCQVQSMPDVSPVKWHLAHTTWFFETFVLKPKMPGYEAFHPQFEYLFNSYYNGVGGQFPRPRRGLLSRPTLAQVLEYRRRVDRALDDLFGAAIPPDVLALLEIGLHHEQQHQELILTDIKHVLSCNPSNPVYRARPPRAIGTAPSSGWHRHAGGKLEIGSCGGFAFDNELPRHQALLEPFELATRLITNDEYLEFVRDGGYGNPALWLSDGWDVVKAEEWSVPLYWSADGASQFTLAGETELLTDEPVSHLSYYEADAFARWAAARLPREAEWEAVACDVAVSGNFVESGVLHPAPADSGPGVRQLFGDVWEWTQSPYGSYPGFRPNRGVVGEYNGKFMCNQFVLRGGSCASPQAHLRATYRNFFPPAARWQFTGLRLARDA